MRQASTWATLLAAPVVGITMFMVVYLFAEAGCSDPLEFIGGDGLRLLTAVAALIAVVAIGAGVWWARRGWASADTAADGPADVAPGDAALHRRFVLRVAIALAVLFALFVVFLAVPVAGGQVCR